MCYSGSVKKEQTEGDLGLLFVLRVPAQKIPEGGHAGIKNERSGVVAEEKLSAKEDRFCREYVIDYNGTQAAIRSGYKGSDAAVRASKLLRKAKVSARIRELQQEMAQRLAMSQDYVVIELVKTYQECKDAEDSKNALRALELMGKHLGMFEKRQKEEGNDDRLEDVL